MGGYYEDHQEQEEPASSSRTGNCLGKKGILRKRKACETRVRLTRKPQTEKIRLGDIMTMIEDPSFCDDEIDFKGIFDSQRTT